MRRVWHGAILGLAALAAPVIAQVQQVDPNTVIDADLGPPTAAPSPTAPASGDNVYYGDTYAPAPAPTAPARSSQPAPAAPQAPAPSAQTFKKDDLIGAAAGVFGDGAKG